jgi:predicted DNA-binding protein with PD1-like motif
MMPGRSIRQPGPTAADRAVVVPAGMVPVEVTLPAGRLIDALAALLSGGIESACLTLSGGAFDPFAYVIPALPPDPSHAAFYSRAFRPAGATRLAVAAVTLGRRDGQPFFHCHALWTEADGRRGCGHVLPPDAVIAAPVHARGAGIIGACFEVRPDAETGFDLFTPHTTGTRLPPRARRAAAIRLAPNQDLTSALEAAGRRAGFRRAAVHGGVASLIGARFADVPDVDGYATEVLVRHGAVRCAPDAGAATVLDVALVDLHGTIGAGCLVPGDNPILMTFEGLLESA